MVVVRPVATGRTWPAIAWILEIIHRLLETQLFGLLGCIDWKRRLNGRNIVGGPMMPCAAGCIGVIAEEDKTAARGRRITPFQGRRQVFAVASEAAGNCGTVGKSNRPQSHKQLLIRPSTGFEQQPKPRS